MNKLYHLNWTDRSRGLLSWYHLQLLLNGCNNHHILKLQNQILSKSMYKCKWILWTTYQLIVEMNKLYHLNWTGRSRGLLSWYHLQLLLNGCNNHHILKLQNQILSKSMYKCKWILWTTYQLIVEMNKLYHLNWTDIGLEAYFHDIIYNFSLMGAIIITYWKLQNQIWSKSMYKCKWILWTTYQLIVEMNKLYHLNWTDRSRGLLSWYHLQLLLNGCNNHHILKLQNQILSKSMYKCKWILWTTYQLIVEMNKLYHLNWTGRSRGLLSWYHLQLLLNGCNNHYILKLQNQILSKSMYKCKWILWTTYQLIVEVYKLYHLNWTDRSSCI